MATDQTRNVLINLNVDGEVFRTTYSTISRYKKAKLFRLVDKKTKQHLGEGEISLFIDRNGEYFKYIIDVHRAGFVHLSNGVCWHRLKEEMEFWELDARACLSACCAQRVLELEEREYMASYLENQLESYVTKTPNAYTENQNANSRCRVLAYKAWIFLEDPTSSLLAQVWGIFFLLVVLLSVFIQVAMSLPTFRRKLSTPNWDVTNETNQKIVMFATTEVQPYIWRIENVNFAIFFLELVTRFLLCPAKCEFFKCIYNWLDIMCITPMIFLLAVNISGARRDKRTLFMASYIFSALGVFRILRLFKFLRHFLCVRVLLLAMKASFREMALLMMLLMVGMLLFSNLVYFAELHVEDEFETIPIGFWWAIVTMTTVGYGDKHPKSSWGYVIGAMCAICGMLLIGIPIPAIANNFNILYTMARRKRMLGARRTIRQKHTPTVSPYIADNDITDVVVPPDRSGCHDS